MTDEEVETATREQLVSEVMWLRATLLKANNGESVRLAKAAYEAAFAEREECARLCDGFAKIALEYQIPRMATMADAAEELASSIRARGR